MTMLWTSAELAAATDGTATTAFTATGVSIDSRSVQPGDLFVALQGQTDGHAHAAAALVRGAAAAMVHSFPPGLADDAPLLLVDDTLAALTDLGAAGRARFSGPVAAVTGSVGKTTTKDMLRLCLSQGGAAHAADASHNNHIGVPLTLARLPREAPACVVEIGMNHPGEILPLARLAAPTVAVITAIAAAHIGHMGSLAAIADEKASIFAGLAPDGVAIVPADAPHLDRLIAASAGRRLILFGDSPESAARLTHLATDADGSDIDATICGTHVAFRLNAPGRHMALNALAALAAADAAGMDVTEAALALETFTAGAGRGVRRAIRLPGGTALLLDESYNASAASIRAALAVLALQPATRRIAVLGEMRELGSHSAAEHRSLAAPVAAVADLAFTCGPDMRALHEAVPGSVHAEAAERLAPMVAAELRAGDAVLVKGSNGSRMRLVVAALDALSSATVA